MENTIEKIMQSLVEQYDKELYLPENELRFKGLLFDFASDFAKELKTLKVALAERIPSKLLASDNKDEEEKQRAMQLCKATLVDEVGLMEERVIQVLNVLAEGLGWEVKLAEKQVEKADKTVEKEKVLAGSEPEEKDEVDYGELVRTVIGCFPRYDITIDGKNGYSSNSVCVGTLSSHIGAEEFSKSLRKLFRKYSPYKMELGYENKRQINCSLSKAEISKGEIWLVIVRERGIREYDSRSYEHDYGYCYTIVIHEIEKDFIDYELIDGFCFSVRAYFDRKVLQNRLQMKDEGE